MAKAPTKYKTPFEKMRELTRRIVQVPKSEIPAKRPIRKRRKPHK